MEKLINLEDLLKHEILDLYSAEEQIINGLPAMIEKVSNPKLKEALSDHLEVTKRQKERLDKIQQVMNLSAENKDKGFFSKLFGGTETVKYKGVEGLIKEAENLMEENMEPETMDAAIIGAAQKIEHYEIAGYGTACAYALELRLDFVADQLEKTLDEEYAADEALTHLAIDSINVRSEVAIDSSMEEDVDNIDDHYKLNDEVLEDRFKPGVDHLATSPVKTVL